MCVAQEGGAYSGNFCADGRFSRPILPLFDYRPPSLVRGGLDGGVCCQLGAKDSDRYLYSAARCQHLLPNEGNRDGNGWLLMLDVFSQMKCAELVVPTCPSTSCLQAPNASCTRKGGRMLRASRTRGPCSRTPLLVLGVRERYVGRLLEV